MPSHASTHKSCSIFRESSFLVTVLTTFRRLKSLMSMTAIRCPPTCNRENEHRKQALDIGVNPVKAIRGPTFFLSPCCVAEARFKSLWGQILQNENIALALCAHTLPPKPFLVGGIYVAQRLAPSCSRNKCLLRLLRQNRFRAVGTTRWFPSEERLRWLLFAADFGPA